MIGRNWDPADLAEIRRAHKTDKWATMQALADRYGTSSGTIYQIVHSAGRFNPERILVHTQPLQGEDLLGHSARWYRDAFMRQHDAVDDYDGLHATAKPYDWDHVTDDSETAAALADLCNVLYCRRFRSTVLKRMGESDRKEEYTVAGADEVRNIAVARLTRKYGLSPAFFAAIFSVSPTTVYWWNKLGQGELGG